MSDSSSGSDVEEWSGIDQPSLLQQIKGILDEYRNDVQIIKELVQNADDAEATEMRILYEGRTINKKHDNERKFRKFLRAPALVFYNDAEFTDADWKGIKTVYSSVKKDDPLKIGRFGLGFKSVFHMTDNPCIISGENVLFIDPHESRPHKVCVMVKLKRLRKWKRLRYRDYMVALEGTFGFSECTITTGRYPGTMFWFPLRQSPSSTLSDNTYSDAQVQLLMNSFIQESRRSLLFLKTLCSVKMYVSLQEKEGISPPKHKKTDTNESVSDLEQINFGKDTVCYSVEINNVAGDLVEKRRAFLSELKGIGTTIPSVSKHWVYDIYIRTESKLKNEEMKISKSRWLILNYLKGGHIHERTRELMLDEDLRYIHIVGLAAPISEQNEYNSNAGHVFCYQPLPQDSASVTGLPVHLNAFFALSQNRRQVRWPDQGDSNQAHGDKKIEWNIALRSEIFPDAYRTLVSEIVRLSKQNGDAEYLVGAVYNSIPNLQYSDPQWNDLGEQYISKCKTQKMIFTEQEQWKSVDSVVFADFRKCHQVGETCLQTVLHVLLQDNIQIAKVPDHVIDSFERLFSDLKYITPTFLVNHMRSNASYKKLTLDQKQDLLEFILLDASPDSLDNIELLPLADATFDTLTATEPIYLECQVIINLFPRKGKKFILAAIRPRIKELLSGFADTGDDCVRRLTDVATVELLNDALKEHMIDEQIVRVQASEIDKWKPWVKGIWELIQTRFKSSVCKFIELPIFPIVQGAVWGDVCEFVLRPLQSSVLHIPSLSQLEDNASVCRSFNAMSVALAEHIPEWLDYGLIREFLYEETSEDLISLFGRITDKSIEKFNIVSSTNDGTALLKYLAERIHSQISNECKRTLQTIKMFNGYSSFNECDRVSLRECNKLYDGNDFPVRFPEVMVRSNTDMELFFAKHLDIEVVSEPATVISTLRAIDKYKTTEKQTFIFWIVNGNTYFNENRELLREIEFLEASDRMFYKPRSLFDPSDDVLVDLFRGDPVFPVLHAEKYHVCISELRNIGLKTRDELTSEDIERTCSRVHQASADNNSVDTAMCRALLLLMNDKSHLLKADTIVLKNCIVAEKLTVENQLRNTPLATRDTHITSVVCMPSEVKSVKLQSLVGSVSYLIDCEEIPHISKLFGWESQPKVHDVIAHLFNIVKSYQDEYKPTCLHLIMSIYKWLAEQQELSIDDVKHDMHDQFASVKDEYVWAGDGFKPPQYVCIDQHQVDIMKPFVLPLPRELSHLSEFFIGIGCRKSPTLDMYLETLYRIKQESENLTSNVDGISLRDKAISILKQIEKDFYEDLDSNIHTLYFPIVHEGTDRLIMKPTKECTYGDDQLLQDIDFDEEDNVFYVHPDVPLATAEALGVPSVRQQMLSDAIAFEEWGQEEPLTRRLRNLLKDGYLDGFSVAKELFQNADDARATKLFILYDERENNDAKTQLINDGMAELQGPAIWVYNDARFTEDDFKNITMLSGGTKEDDSTKIGKFGLGFCAVYNITDVPSFVSGENAVFFDPHMTFLGKALSGKSPGLRINFQAMKNLRMMKRLRNQFKPYEGIFDCKLRDSTSPSIDGTLFRLPLRNRASDISDIVYTPTEVKCLFEKIMKMGANMLLFNQYVKEVKVFYLPKSERNPLRLSLLYEACRESLRLVPELDTSTTVACPVIMEASARKQKRTLVENPLRLVERVTIVVKRHSAAEFQPQDSSLASETELVGNWLVSWSTGCSETILKLAYDEKGALPLGAVAVPVRYSSDICEEMRNIEILSLSQVPVEFYNSGSLFFFLPLPIKHKFPYHINSQFTVSTDRRMLKTSTDDDKNTKMKQWNECLFSDPVTHALLYLLEKLNLLGILQNYQNYQLWPRNETEQLFECLPQAFYRNIVRPGIFNVFEKEGMWFDISRCVFLEPDFRSSVVGDTAFETLSCLTQYTIDIPNDIHALLQKADHCLIQEKTVSARTFFLKYFLPQLDKFGVDTTKQRNDLLRYAIQLQDTHIDEWLKSNKCIPSQPNGHLHHPMDLIDPGSKLAVLFRTSDGYFPEEEFTGRILLDHLRNIGLINEHLPNAIVSERARSIQEIKTQCSACASERTGHLIAYLCEKQSKHQSIISELQQIEFFPVKCKPVNWPFKWHNESNESTTACPLHKGNDRPIQVTYFDRACNMFHKDSMNIVGCIEYVFENTCNVSDRLLKKTDMNQLLNDMGMRGMTKNVVDSSVVIKQLNRIASDPCNYSYRFENEKIFSAIYEQLEEACKHDDTTYKHIADELKDKAIVLVSQSQTLCFPKEVARKTNIDCKPYLYKLDDSPLKSCDRLCHCLEVVDYFHPKNVALVIQTIKDTKGEEELSEAEIRLVIRLLDCLYTTMNEAGIFCTRNVLGDNVQAVYGPDEYGVLRDCTTMCFNDCYKMEKSETMIYAHGNFSICIAKAFGVKPKALHNLEDNSEDIEDFYQDEPLVTRLQRLVEGYPCDSGLFKELLQNADDANATEIIFLKDYVYHPVDNIEHLLPTFKPMQGPAVCVFNNSAFSNKDLKGIQMLGRGSKSDDPSQTGRYGVGFNSVYNLTDAPSFYTRGGNIKNGETVCMFDPLAQYIPNATRKKAGKRYTNVTSIRHYHSDMLSGYHEQLYLNERKYTAFRFPLRTQASEIRKDPISMEYVSNILENFCIELREVMLFLKNLKAVKVMTHRRRGCYEEDFSIEMQINNIDQLKQNDMANHYAHMCEDVKLDRSNVFKVQHRAAVYEVSLISKHNRIETDKTGFIVVQTLGFKDASHVPPLIHDAFVNGKLGLLPHGGVAFRVGNNQMLNQFELDLELVDTCKAFCFLPLPVFTGLPVHVHGYFSLDHESRRTLWKALDETCFRTLWNLTLIKLVISPAYILLIEYIKQKTFKRFTGVSSSLTSVSRNMAIYQSCFPLSIHAADYYWKHLMCCVYKELVVDNIEFLPVQETSLHIDTGSYNNHTRTCTLAWTSLEQPGNPYPAYVMPESKQNDTCNTHSDFNNIMRRIGMRIVYVTDEMKTSMEISEVQIVSLTPKAVIDFICTFKFPNAGKCRIETEKHIKETVLMNTLNVKQIMTYCIDDADYFLSSLKNMPLMVTQDDIVRTLPEEGYIFVEATGRFCDFFSTKLHKFLCKGVASVLVSQYKKNIRLCTIRGLKQFELREFISLVEETCILDTDCSHNISWDKKTPSVNWIQKFWEFFRHILNYGNVIDRRQLVIEQLHSVKFLPLIPATGCSTETPHLVPPTGIKCLIDLKSFEINRSVHEMLLRMNVLQVDRKVLFRVSTYELLQEHVPNIQHVFDVIECFHLNVSKMETAGITCTQAESVLRYFNDSVSINMHSSWEAINQVKAMPLFESHFGKLVTLTKYQNIFIVPRDIPKGGLQDLAEKSNILLLCDKGLNQLFEYLGIQSLSLIDVYKDYIIPNQAQLQRVSFYSHVEYLSEHILSKEEDISSLLSVLGKEAFIETMDERIVKVCDLFDHDNMVFKILCKSSELLPMSLRKFSILQMFRQIGLKSELTIQHFERFAREIEKMGKSEALSADVVRKSKVLTLHLIQMNTTFFLDNIFSDLANIKFVVPFVVENKLSVIQQQFSCHQLICFNGAVLKASQHLSWTVANILPVEADPTFHSTRCLTDTIVDKLSICQKPSCQKLVQHCGHIGNNLGEKLIQEATKICHSTLTVVMGDIYKALAEYKNNDELTNESVRPLANVPMVYFPGSKTVLVSKRVVNSCRDGEEIKPYLTKCPTEFTQYQDLFLLLGAKKEPSTAAYASVLYDLKEQCGGSASLLPKETADGTKAMGYLFKYLMQQSEQCNIQEDHLFLLSETEVFETARSLVLSNNTYYQKQLTKSDSTHLTFLLPLEKLQAYKMKTEECVDSLQWLPQKHRPFLLTDIVRERVILENVVNKESRIATNLEEFIHGRCFVYGFFRLVRHVLKSDNKGWNQSDESKLADLLKKVSFRHTAGIETTLVVLDITSGELGDETPVENTTETKSAHLEITEERVCMFFDTAEVKWAQQVTKQLTIYLNGLVGKCLRDENLMILMEIIGMTASPEGISLFLSKEKIEEFQTTVTIDESPAYPTPGTFVPKHLHSSLDNDYGAIPEYEYKFIALEVDDPYLMETNEEDDTQDTDKDMGTTYIFVHIIRKTEQMSGLPLLQEYEIDDGTDSPRIVKAYQLYRFVRKQNTMANSEREVIVYEGISSGESDIQQTPLSLKETFNEIRKYLREAWKEPESDRRSIVKRLLLKWHPDKNPNNVVFCTKVFQYIQQCLRLLESGQELTDDDEDTDSGPRTHTNWSSSWYGRYWERSERRRRNYNRSYTGRRYDNFDHFWTFRRGYSADEEQEPYHWYTEARRWQRQSMSDLRNARASMQDATNHDFNWVCYKAHQAAEKSLKAAWYAKDANKLSRVKYSHNLYSIASGLGTEIAALASSLSAATGDHSKMRYPDMFAGQQIPAEAYTMETANEVICIAQDILEKVESNHIK